jgi:hypothetical protein
MDEVQAGIDAARADHRSCYECPGQRLHRRLARCGAMEDEVRKVLQRPKFVRHGVTEEGARRP